METNGVRHKKQCWFKDFPDIQDYLGQAKGQRQPGGGREQGRPQDLTPKLSFHSFKSDFFVLLSKYLITL